MALKHLFEVIWGDKPENLTDKIQTERLSPDVVTAGQ